jgi:hypothetical protein
VSARVRQRHGKPIQVRVLSISGPSLGWQANGGGSPTSVLTVITDRFGNLVNIFPGKLNWEG